MLKLDVLDQLKQLKSDIKASRNLQLGRVKGTGQKFGFIALDSGKDVFLPPTEMLRVLPGDRVEVEILKDEKNKTFARIERMIESVNKEFFGKYVAKGPAHFAEADFDGSTRWIFIPPNKRGKTKEGDLLRCKLTQHPIKNGKPQAHILENLGSEKQVGIEWVYSLAKHYIAQEWSSPAKAELDELNEASLEAHFAERKDYSDKPFYTIDGEKTTDMDDALLIESKGDGWIVYVAIADPEALLNGSPKLESEALARGASLYSPGKIVPMLPEKLSSELCSLLEGKRRLAKVVKVEVDAAGSVQSFDIDLAIVCSHHKLSYTQASEPTADSPVKEQLELLKALAERLLNWRRENANVQSSRQEFYIELNDDKKIAAIKPRPSHEAHSWVEECMLLANRCIAQYLQERTESGLYISHAGVRADRLETLEKVLREHVDSLKEVSLSELSGFREAMRVLLSDEDFATYKNLLLRQLERTEYCDTHQPHFGLGFDCYTTFTSPLRKANDYLVHKQVRESIESEKAGTIDKRRIQRIEEKQDAIRKSVYDIDQSLKCEFMSRQSGAHEAEVVRVFTTGMQVRIVENGIEGLLSSRDIEGKCSFNQELMQMKTSAGTFGLGQNLTVEVRRIDWSKKQVQFNLSLN